MRFPKSQNLFFQNNTSAQILQIISKINAILCSYFQNKSVSKKNSVYNFSIIPKDIQTLPAINDWSSLDVMADIVTLITKYPLGGHSSQHFQI
jgi:hypothetical protein